MPTYPDQTEVASLVYNLHKNGLQSEEYNPTKIKIETVVYNPHKNGLQSVDFHPTKIKD